MKKVNEAFVAKKAEREDASKVRTEIINFLGDAIAEEFNVTVGEFSRPNLVFSINGRQFSVSISAREKALSLDAAHATFVPTKK